MSDIISSQKRSDIMSKISGKARGNALKVSLLSLR